MRTELTMLPPNTWKRLRFIVAGFCVSMAVLVPGVLWYRSVIQTVAVHSARQISSAVNVRFENARRQMETELAVTLPAIRQSAAPGPRAKARRGLPFDLVVIFDHERKLVDGYRTLAVTNASVDLTPEAAKVLVPLDTGFFDELSDKSSVSGILMLEEKPLIIASQRISLSSSGAIAGYAVIGRWFDVDSMTMNGDKKSDRFDVFSVGRENAMPPDIRAALSLAQRNNGFTFDLIYPGRGVLYILLDDMMKRPALMVKQQWSLPWQSSETLGFSIFYLVSVTAGVVTWMLLTYFDYRNRHRMRRFEGITSLSQENLRIFVENFPGYAFALNSKFKYIGVSRILAGLTGNEPSDFAGMDFGGVTSEYNGGTIPNVFAELRDPARWPPVSNIEHVTQGLGLQFSFTGTAHYIGKHGVLLVVLSKKEGAPSVRLPESYGSIDRPNSAVA